MPKPAALVTAAEISRLAGVTRATVSNWRRRHADFPAPTGGTEASPAYDLDAVRSWLAARDQLPAGSPADDLRTALRALPGDNTAASRLLPLVLAADRMTAVELKALLGGPLPDQAQDAIRPYLADLPSVEGLEYRTGDTALLETLLRCVQEEGAAQAIDVIAERTPEESGTYQTPAPLVELMADLLAGPDESFPTSVFDPACGTGGLLAAAARRGAQELYGQEIVPAQAVQAAVRLSVLTRTAKVGIHAGDSMRAHAFPDLIADAVLCNPPYGNRDWGHDELAYDPRWAYGLPPKSEPELAWIQHCLAYLAPGARAVLLMPPAAAERAAGRRTRAELVRSGALRAVVALPPGAAAPFHIGLHLWLLQRPQPQASAPQHVLFVDTADPSHGRQPNAEMSRRPPLDWTALRDTVLGEWHAYTANGDGFETNHGTAHVIPVIDLLDESVDLTPARHVRTSPAAIQPDQHAETARAIRARLHRAVAGLAILSDGESWPPTGAEPRSWRTATVADLLRGGALTLLRTAISGRIPAIDRLPAEAEHTTGSRVLTLQDVVQGQPPSATPDDISGAETEIRTGDVILPELLRNGSHPVRVADDHDAGQILGRHLFLLRADPQRLDPWFLAGFLSAEDNINAAATGTSIIRIDVRRLRVPLLPLAEQQRYGHAFRQLRALRTAADLAHRLAEQTAHTLGIGLTGGALLPPDAGPIS